MVKECQRETEASLPPSTARQTSNFKVKHPRSKLFYPFAALYGPSQGTTVGCGGGLRLGQESPVDSLSGDPSRGGKIVSVCIWRGSINLSEHRLSTDLIQPRTAQNLLTQGQLRWDWAVQGSHGELLGGILSPI